MDFDLQQDFLKTIDEGKTALLDIKNAHMTQQAPNLEPLLAAIKDFVILAKEVADLLKGTNPPSASPPA